MSQQFTKPFVQSHYHGYTGADDDYGACEDVTGLHEHCVRNLATVPQADIKSYDIKPQTRSSHCDCGNCSCGTSKIDCPSSGDATQTEIIHWDDQGCCATCTDQRRCSAPNVYDCANIGTNAAVSAVKTYKEPDDSKDRTITCTYDIKTSADSSGADDFSKTSTVQAYLNAYGTDQVFNTVIAPYFCSFPADLVPDWAGKDQAPLDGAGRSVWPSGAKPVASRFVGNGKGGDSDICRNWATNGDPASESLATTTMTTWCAQHKWLPECECIEKLDPVYGSDYFEDLYVGMGKEVPGCWWAPCSRSRWDERDMLVTPSDVDAANCDTACSNIIFVINSSDVNLSDIQQDMACTINEQDIDQKNGGDHPDVDCSTQADPKLCTCNGIEFTTSDTVVQSGIAAMGAVAPITNPANQQLVADKLNAYAAAACYSDPPYTDHQLETWLESAPVITAVPLFDHATGAFQGNYNQTRPSAGDIEIAQDNWKRTQSASQFPCKQTYDVFLDVEQTKTGTIVNENYAACAAAEQAKFSVPDPETQACPYTFYTTDEHGQFKTFPVNDTYRAMCVQARGGVPYLPVDGDDPGIDAVDQQYGLCVPTSDGKCPATRTYTDDTGVVHTKTMDADEIAACQSDPAYVPDGNDDGGNDGGDDNDQDDDQDDDTDSGSTLAKVLMAGAAAIGIAAFVALGVTIYRHSSSKDKSDALSGVVKEV